MLSVRDALNILTSLLVIVGGVYVALEHSHEPLALACAGVALLVVAVLAVERCRRRDSCVSGVVHGGAVALLVGAVAGLVYALVYTLGDADEVTARCDVRFAIDVHERVRRVTLLARNCALLVAALLLAAATRCEQTHCGYQRLDDDEPPATALEPVEERSYDA